MYDVDYKKIGLRIKKLRIKNGYTQEQLGEKIGCSNNHISHIETGTNKVSLTLLLRLSHAFEISLDYFLLDTPFARPEAIVDFEISKKLSECSASTLVTINHMIDTLLEQQKNIDSQI